MGNAIVIPRLTLGRGLKGPEPFGCYNTGVAPVILRSRASGRYLVGPEIAVDEVRGAHLLVRNARRRRFGKGRETVWVFRTRAPAAARFRELVSAAEARNAEMRSECDGARRDAASRDPETALIGTLRLAEF